MVMKTSDKVLMLNKLDNSIKQATAYTGNLPNTNDEREQAAGELFLAYEALRKIKARVAAATERARMVGIPLDKENSGLEPGDNKTLFVGSHVIVGVKVSHPAVTYPAQTLKLLMIQQGIPLVVVEELFDAAAKKSANPHVFTVSLIDETTARPDVPVKTGAKKKQTLAAVK